MKKVTFAILGMGNRGTKYASQQLKYGDRMEITAMADTRRVRLDAANKYLQLPANRLFDGADSLLSQPKLADILVVATQDAQHREHALRAMEVGYDLLLEKPISNKIEDIAAIVAAAKRLNRRVIVCHVLRYTAFYAQAKALIDSGVIGDVVSVQAAEHVGYYHYAHSYVRGNWHRCADSSPMILAKCSHDMDILQWLTGKKCVSVSSFGQLSYFNAAHRPAGAPERCADCKLDCPYNANKFYISRIPGWPANVLHPEPTPENITEILANTDYGKCVFAMNNDVVDHQVVNLLMEDGVTVDFQMTGFTNRMTRTLHVMGTEGEVWGDFHEKELYVQRFGGEKQKIDLEALCDDFTGHGGGDSGLVRDVIRLYLGDDFDSSAVTFLEPSAQSHYMAFAAEQSRLNGGQPIDLETFIANIG